MKVLIQMQWRLIRNSLILWTVVGLIFSYAISGGGFTMGPAEQVPMFVVVVAAALGTRLFSREVMGPQGVYLRGLPISWGRLFLLKVGMALCALCLCVLVHALFWHAGPLGNILKVMKGNSQFVPLAAPSGFAWQMTCVMSWIAFTASAFFANTFEKIQASRQAGVPGFIVAFAISNISLQTVWVKPSLPYFIIMGLCGIVLLVAAWRIGRRRGVGETDPRTRVLGRLNRIDRLVILPACLIAVVLPLFSALYEKMTQIHPYVHVETVVLTGACWLAIGVLAIPWSIRQVRSRSVTGIRAVAILLLNLTGLGIFIWRAIRSRGEMILCRRCVHRRMPHLTACPSCASRAIHPEPAWRGMRRFVPTTGLLYLEVGAQRDVNV